MNSSGIIYPEKKRDKPKTENALKRELKSTPFDLNASVSNTNQTIVGDTVKPNVRNDRIDDFLNIPENYPEGSSMDAEIENKQFKYDIPKINTQNYNSSPIRTVATNIRSRDSNYSNRNDEQSNLSKSFMIDHEKAMIRRKKYQEELNNIKKNSTKKKKLKKNTSTGKIGRKSSSKTSGKKYPKTKTDKKKEIRKHVEKVKQNDKTKKESIFKDIFSLNIVQNIVLRYVVAIVSGIIIFGIIFSGLGLIGTQ